MKPETPFNYGNSNLPDEFKGFSPMMINALLNLGFSGKDTILLITFADQNNHHPDWSEATDEEIADHFYSLAKFTL